MLSLGFSLKDSSVCPLYPKTSFPCEGDTACSPAPGSLALGGVLPPHPSSLCLQEKIKTMFEQLVLVDHPNIVKLHKYWLDVKDSKARVGRTQGDKVSGGGWQWEPGGDPSSAPHTAPRDSPSFPRTRWPAALSAAWGLALVACCCGQCSRGLCTALAVRGGCGADTSLPSQVIFITEYVSSGSLKQFLKKTKKNHKAMNARVGALGAAPGVPGEAGSSVPAGTGQVSGLL